jgi:peptide-methionine (S)-S-oxide reductase
MFFSEAPAHRMRATHIRRKTMSQSSVILGAGCYSCAQALFQQVRGVISAEAGFVNGNIADEPSYDAVMSDKSDHAEAVKVVFRPDVISLRDVLAIFFTIHDPTSLNRQGDSVGRRYRSGIYVSDEDQKALAAAVIREIDQGGELSGPVVTEIEFIRNYWPAGDERQNAFLRNPQAAYCTNVIGPKVSAFRETAKKYIR